MTQISMQIGKNGVTEGTIEWLKNAFKTHEIVKISVLKSGGHEKEKVKEIADKMISELGRKFTYRIVGFTISVRKWRKDKR